MPDNGAFTAQIEYGGMEWACNSPHEAGGSEDIRMGWHRHLSGGTSVLSWAEGRAWLEAPNRAQLGGQQSSASGTVVVREGYGVTFRPERDDAELVVPDGATASHVLVRGPFRAQWVRLFPQPLGWGARVWLGAEYAVTGPNEDDWTRSAEGRSNSSPQFTALTREVERIIRGSAHDLIAGRAGSVAGVVMAQLAHRHGLRPPPFHGVPAVGTAAPLPPWLDDVLRSAATGATLDFQGHDVPETVRQRLGQLLGVAAPAGGRALVDIVADALAEHDYPGGPDEVERPLRLDQARAVLAAINDAREGATP